MGNNDFIPNHNQILNSTTGVRTDLVITDVTLEDDNTVYTCSCADNSISSSVVLNVSGKLCMLSMSLLALGESRFLLLTIVNPLRTVVAYMRQGKKLDYHAQTNRYNFAAHHPTNLKLLSFCSVYSAENSNIFG